MVPKRVKLKWTTVSCSKNRCRLRKLALKSQVTRKKRKRTRKRKRRTRKRSEALRVMKAQQMKRSLPHRAEKMNLRLRISRSILQERTRHKKIMKLTSISSKSSSTNRSSRMKRKMKMKLTIPMTLMTTLKTSKTKRMMTMMRRMAVTRKTRCSSMWMSWTNKSVNFSLPICKKNMRRTPTRFRFPKRSYRSSSTPS